MNEDRFIAEIKEDFQLFGVFDGHGGTSCVDYLFTHFFYYFDELFSIIEINETKTDSQGHEILINWIKEALTKCQESMPKDRSGSTANIVLLSR